MAKENNEILKLEILGKGGKLRCSRPNCKRRAIQLYKLSGREDEYCPACFLDVLLSGQFKIKIREVK